MKLKLKNFKKYHDKEIELPDKGLILLSGDSGAGKSSIIKAILYVLYGQVKAPYSFGTSTCSVELEYEGLNICRTSSPNTLKVIDEKGNIFEKTSAQGVIDDRIKQNYKKFMLASYIPQKNNSSILSLTPTEQLSLIQLLSFTSGEDYKEVLKRMIRTKNDSLHEQRTKTDYLQQRYDKQIQGFEIVNFPLHLEEGETEDQQIIKYKRKLTDNTRQIIELNDKTKDINIKIQNKINLENKLKLKNEKLEMYKPLLEEKNKELNSIKSKIDKIPPNIAEELEHIKNNIEYNNLLIKLKELEDEYNEIKKEIESYEENATELWPDKTHQESLDDLEYLNECVECYQNLKIINQKLGSDLKIKTIKEMKNYIKNEITSVQKNLKDAIEKKILYEKSKEIKICPECGTHLSLNEGKLVKCENVKDLKDLIHKNDKNINEMETKLSLLKECQISIKDVNDEIKNPQDLPPGQGIKELKDYIKKNEELENDIDKNLSSLKINLKKIEEKISKLKTNKELKKIVNPKTTEYLNKRHTELDILFSQTKSLKKDHETINRKRLELEKNINDLNSEIKKINIEMQELDIEELNNDLSIIDEQIALFQEEYNSSKELEPLVEEYIQYKNKENDLISIQEELDTEYENLKVLDLEYGGYVKLKEKYLKAEIMSLNITINNINQHTEYFLDKFFIVNKLTAVLDVSDTTENLKIETRLTFLGNEYDKISELSGGEFDRCTLASVCGINTLLGSPILILDESLSSLNSEKNTDIISFLKEFATNKLIIVCSHEAVRGIFDEIKEIY